MPELDRDKKAAIMNEVFIKAKKEVQTLFTAQKDADILLESAHRNHTIEVAPDGHLDIMLPVTHEKRQLLAEIKSSEADANKAYDALLAKEKPILAAHTGLSAAQKNELEQDIRYTIAMSAGQAVQAEIRAHGNSRRGDGTQQQKHSPHDLDISEVPNPGTIPAMKAKQKREI